ncbi:hypothetical protein ColKHC_05373 [Colletotrichum higginsianum]|nr:hypothetical protein ColKHC_05373 [Colletotrichum higginsianum]
MRDTAVRDDHYVIVAAHVADELPQSPPRLGRPLLQLLERGLPPGLRARFVGPVRGDPAEVDAAGELGFDIGDSGPRVAGRVRDLLHLGQGEDPEGLTDGGGGVGGEAQEAGVQGAAQGAGDEVCEAGVVGKGGAEGGALLLAQVREEGVADSLVLEREVVEALGVADEVDLDGHFRGCVSFA